MSDEFRDDPRIEQLARAGFAAEVAESGARSFRYGNGTKEELAPLTWEALDPQERRLRLAFARGILTVNAEHAAPPFPTVPPSLWPVRVISDGFDGKFSGGPWIAYFDDGDHGRDDEIWNFSQCDPQKAAAFWKEAATADHEQVEQWIAVGETPNEAVETLLDKALR